jgi:diadenylate cyclase
VDEIVNASSALGRQRIGALIVIERETGLDEFVDKGVVLEALLTRQLLINIFFKNSPLHDGAVIVRGDRIVAARCIMPLSEQELPGQFGTRHRAALGISEESDAVALIVSEQSGDISIAHDGQIDRDLSSERLRQHLVDLVVYEQPNANGSLVGRFRPFRS